MILGAIAVWAMVAYLVVPELWSRYVKRHPGMEEIREAFKTYYEGAEMGEQVEPARMYQIKADLDASGVYLSEELDRFTSVYFKPRERQSAADHQAMNAALDPAVSRFEALFS